MSSNFKAFLLKKERIMEIVLLNEKSEFEVIASGLLVLRNSPLIK
jgi:hypothetical protein